MPRRAGAARSVAYIPAGGWPRQIIAPNGSLMTARVPYGVSSPGMTISTAETGGLCDGRGDVVDADVDPPERRGVAEQSGGVHDAGVRGLPEEQLGE